jgi:hypothetical protein
MVRCLRLRVASKTAATSAGLKTRQLFLVPRVWNVFNHPVAVEDVMIEEAQGTNRLIEQCP